MPRAHKILFRQFHLLSYRSIEMELSLTWMRLVRGKFSKLVKSVFSKHVPHQSCTDVFPETSSLGSHCIVHTAPSHPARHTLKTKLCSYGVYVLMKECISISSSADTTKVIISSFENFLFLTPGLKSLTFFMISFKHADVEGVSTRQ